MTDARPPAGHRRALRRRPAARCSAAAATTCGAPPLPAARPVPVLRRERGRRRRAVGPRARCGGGRRSPRAPPGYAGAVPYGFGVVELPEGLRVITRLADPDDSLRRSASRCTCGSSELGTRRRRHGRHHVGVRAVTARSRSPASASTRSGGSTDRTVTDMGVDRGARRARRGRHRPHDRPTSRPRSAAPRTAGVAAGHKVLGALALHRHPDRRHRSRLRERRRRARSSRPARSAPGSTTRVLVFGMEKMPKGIIRSQLLRAVARGGRARGDARVLRAPRPAPDARARAHQGRPRRASW